ncbi:MAG: HAMP domain-containing sensor histidine kinase, partial [Bacteroidales bacterium]
LVSNLLNMTNMDDYDEKSSVCLKDIFEDITSELSFIAKNKTINISLNCDDCTVYGNTDLLYRAFYNLIENGIKYNVINGKVSVAVKNLNDKYVSIKICDTGIGIPNEMKKHIFEPFYRVDKSRSRLMGGAGLGLSIVDSIIKKHSGTIVVSDNKDGGSCFEIILETQDNNIIV